MAGKVRMVLRDVNGITVGQRQADGFINGTAMAIAHGKNITAWFRNQETIELLLALADDLGVTPKYEISHNSSITSISAALPSNPLSRAFNRCRRSSLPIPFLLFTIVRLH